MHSVYALVWWTRRGSGSGQPYPSTRCGGWLASWPGLTAQSHGGRRWRGWAAGAKCEDASGGRTGRSGVLSSTGSDGDDPRGCSRGADGVQRSGSARRRATKVQPLTWWWARRVRKEQQETSLEFGALGAVGAARGSDRSMSRQL